MIVEEWPEISQHIAWIHYKTDYFNKKYFKNADIRSLDNNILVEILRLGGECAQEDLDKTTFVHRSSISRELRLLEARGLVELFTDPDNRFRNKVRLLDTGWEYSRKALKRIEDYEKKITENLSDIEKEKLTGWLKTYYRDAYPDADSQNNELPEGWPAILHYLFAAGRFFFADMMVKNNKHNLELNQKRILTVMGRIGDGCSYKAIEKGIMVDQSVVVRQIRKLMELGLVDRVFDENDKRICRASLTEKGREIADDYSLLFQNYDKNACKSLNDDEKEDFLRMLKLIWTQVDRELTSSED